MTRPVNAAWCGEDADRFIGNGSVKARGKYLGEMTFRLKYGDQVGEPFEWLHVDFDTLSAVASQTGWSAERLVGESSGDYLCCLRSAV
jgi:hypothetical protein